MKIVQILAGTGEGGLEKHVIELSNTLKNKNIDISVVAHKKFKNYFKNLNFIELDLTKSRNNIFTLYKLYNILKIGQYDIIHTQANKATDMVIKLKPFLNAKIISTLHNYKNNLNSFEKSDFVITVSNKIGEKLKNPNKKTIYNGIKIENIPKINLHELYNIPKDKFIICGVGRFVKAKRFDTLIESIKNLDVYLILVGDGPEYKKLEQLTKELNLQHRVVFTGALENNKTKKIIKSVDLLCISSEREGFPYVFVETLLLQTPILSTDVSDVGKFLPNKYVISIDSKVMAKKIQYIKNNYKKISEEYHSIFTNNNILQKFSIDFMTNETLAIYNYVLNN